MKQMRVDVGGHQVTTFSDGTGDEVVLLIHGGPGCPSDYLRESHAPLVAQGFRVVTWDQLGSGSSDLPDDKSLWTVARFVEETRMVCDALGLARVHVLGQPWGGILGLDFALAYPERVRSFIGANTAFDLPRMQRGFERKKQALGEETCVMMGRHEAMGSTDHPEYQAAVTILMYRHMCRVPVWPAGLKKSMAGIGQSVFTEMFGPYFFNCTGTLRDHYRLDRLKDFDIPTLLIQGEHDYLIPDLAATARDLIPGARLHVLSNCSHMPFYEDPAAYFGVLVPFLRAQDGQARPKPTS